MDTSSGTSKTVKSQQLDPEDDQEVNSRLLVWWQKMHESQRCYGDNNTLDNGHDTVIMMLSS